MAGFPGGLFGEQDHVIKDEAEVPPYTLPDVLTMSDGTPVRTAEEWVEKRRPEILRLFEDHVHGRTPAGMPAGFSFRVVEEDRQALDGAAHRKQVEIRFSDDPAAPLLHLLVYTPAEARGPVPVFLCLHFNGNWAVCDDPGVRLYPRWDRDTKTRVMPPADTPRGRSPEWNVPLVLSRGYGIAAVWYGDIEPDWKEGAGMRFGVRGLFLPPGQAERGPHDWGAIGAWAWGLSRALDYLVTDGDVDGGRVIAVGQSRLGKTVLWAAARDPRFAMVIASCSGEGGASLSRRDFGENIDNMTTSYLYQFSDAFKRYNKRWNDLPVDAHMLLALVAPRPLLLNTGSEDLWSDPHGEFLAAQAASPVYELLGKRGLASEPRPSLDEPLLRDIAYHEHAGGHAILPSDWKVFLDFADRQLRR